MGTRSITCVLDEDGNKIIEMYKQLDGYPSGLGIELQEFLKDGVITNGISLGENRKTFNGMGCLAAQLVEHFKDGVGGVYLHAPTRNFKNKKKYSDIYWADYYYEISKQSDKIQLKCWNTYTNQEEEITEFEDG